MTTIIDRPAKTPAKAPAATANRGLRILCHNGHLGFAPTKIGSFERGLAAEPDMIACDSGSSDCGPIPLGSDGSASPLAWQTHDIEAMLLGARRLGVPMIIGSAGDTGTDSRVDRYVGIVRDLAKKHGLAPFRLGYFYSEISPQAVRERMLAGAVVSGLDGRPDLSLDELAATDRIVAVAGVHPYIKLLDMGAEVIIGGRSSDCAIFAHLPSAWLSRSARLLLWQVLECASFCAEPYAGRSLSKITMARESDRDAAGQRCTVASVAAHAMYERSNLLRVLPRRPYRYARLRL